jgi:hypothetical protein
MDAEDYIEDMESELSGYFDLEKTTHTLSKMYQFKRVFGSIEEVDNEIFQAQEYYKALCGLNKEVGLSKIDEVSDLKEKIQEKIIAINLSCNRTESKFSQQFKTATEKKEYQKLKTNEFNIDLYRLEGNYDVILNFLNEQMWMMKSYLKSLDERRKHQVAMVNLTK